MAGRAPGISVILARPIRSPAAAQLAKFMLVGASGYAVNIAVYTALFSGVGLHYELAALGAFSVAVANNYALNRVWTFATRRGAARHEAPRFLAVSVAGFLLGAGLLAVLVRTGAPEVPAQMIAVVAVAPFSFLLNRAWTFRGEGSTPLAT